MERLVLIKHQDGIQIKTVAGQPIAFVRPDGTIQLEQVEIGRRELTVIKTVHVHYRIIYDSIRETVSEQ